MALIEVSVTHLCNLYHCGLNSWALIGVQRVTRKGTTCDDCDQVGGIRRYLFTKGVVTNYGGRGASEVSSLRKGEPHEKF